VWQAAHKALEYADRHAESLARRKLTRAQTAKVEAETAALRKGDDVDGDVQLVVRVRRTAPDAAD
ncbi:MAG TPA: hypothetical protein VIU16_02595, partial [Gaiellaceae bacterium]